MSVPLAVPKREKSRFGLRTSFVHLSKRRVFYSVIIWSSRMVTESLGNSNADWHGYCCGFMANLCSLVIANTNVLSTLKKLQWLRVVVRKQHCGGCNRWKVVIVAIGETKALGLALY
jgi:hypothetical protein